MNRTGTWCLIGVLLVASGVWSKDKNAGGGTDEAIVALEQKWMQSQKTNNPDMVAPLLADKFVNTGSDGKVASKSEALANAKATKYESVDYENGNVRYSGIRRLRWETSRGRARIRRESL